MVQAVTLPGLGSVDDDRGSVRLEDHVAAVVDVLRGGVEPAVLAGHSGAGTVIYGATDRVPDLVRRAVYIDSWPLSAAMQPDLDEDVTELPLPTWEELEADGSSLEGLDDEALAAFRSRALPQPANAVREGLDLRDPRRRDVPVTLICTSTTSDEVRDMVAAEHPFFADLAGLAVEYLDLPTGHWPMWSRPADLAALLASLT